MAGSILVGTSSWADPGFVEDWYPKGMAARDRLAWYADRFEYVEVNSSFYAVPAQKTVARWAEITPKKFTFDVKLHRLLSRHSAGLDSLLPELRPKAKADERGRVVLTPQLQDLLVESTLEAVEPLAEAGKLGPFLLQLTPAFSPAKHKLEELEPLAERLREPGLAIELRNRNWVEGERLEETLDWYESHGVTFVCVDSPPGDNFQILPPVDAVTRRDVAYMRMHGRDTEGYLKGKTVAERFGWVYSDDELAEIAGRAKHLAEDAGQVHVAFNNNRSADAPDSARRFRELIGQDPGPRPDAPRRGEQMELA
ncbi:MAG TPA: DUF72 domain-containing protein [Thermoleophilaceae bacterium]|jgi:uncharacterized protein YecE (DUF72 family)|nr:DUF72 domain-containing protein [Thermoleophilaceae bacterium]